MVKAGYAIEGRKLTSHSLKATCLSFAAKMGFYHLIALHWDIMLTRTWLTSMPVMPCQGKSNSCQT